jgi:hypothetical protein
MPKQNSQINYDMTQVLFTNIDFPDVATNLRNNGILTGQQLPILRKAITNVTRQNKLIQKQSSTSSSSRRSTKRNHASNNMDIIAIKNIQNQLSRRQVALKQKEETLATLAKDLDLRYEGNQNNKIIAGNAEENSLVGMLNGYIPDSLDRYKQANNAASTFKKITRCIKTDTIQNNAEDIYDKFEDLTAATQDILITKLENSDVQDKHQKQLKKNFLKNLQRIHKTGFRKLMMFFVNFMIVYFLTFTMTNMLGNERNVNPSLLSLPSAINPTSHKTTKIVRDLEFATNLKNFFHKTGYLQRKYTRSKFFTQKVQDYFDIPIDDVDLTEYYTSPLFFQVLILETKENFKKFGSIDYEKLKELSDHYDKLEANSLGVAGKIINNFITNKQSLKSFLDKYKYDDNFIFMTKEQKEELSYILDNIINNLQKIIETNDEKLPKLQKNLDFLIQTSSYKNILDSFMKLSSKEDIKYHLDIIYDKPTRFIDKIIEKNKFERIHEVLDNEKKSISDVKKVIQKEIENLASKEFYNIRDAYMYVSDNIGSVLGITEKDRKPGYRGEMIPLLVKYEDDFLDKLIEIEGQMFKRERLEVFRKKFDNRYYFSNMFNLIVSLLGVLLLNKRKNFSDSIYYIKNNFNCSTSAARYVYHGIAILCVFVLIMINAENYQFVHEMFDTLKNIFSVWFVGNIVTGVTKVIR